MRRVDWLKKGLHSSLVLRDPGYYEVQAIDFVSTVFKPHVLKLRFALGSARERLQFRLVYISKPPIQA